MVKADVKRNYYADLELSGQVSSDDIKKQYKKLALKYHPDRNPGKEAEMLSKFQAIQAAHEILNDPVAKAKYDADRRKAGLVPSFARTASSAARPPPTPYAPPGASSAWPPPPRRTATDAGPASWRTTSNAGADRFANFPKPSAPTSKKPADKANVFEAWTNMGRGTNSPHPGPARPQPKGAFGASPQKPRAPPPPPPPPAASNPPRQDTRFPTEDDIRAGMNHRPAPAGGFSDDRSRSAWAEFNAQNSTKPGVARSNTTRAPKKTGFDPLAGGDERQAANTSNYSRRRSEDHRAYPPPPPLNDDDRPVFGANDWTASGERDAPYTEGTKPKTPYSSHIGQQTYSSTDNLPGKARASAKQASPQPTKTGSRQKPFVVYSSSEDDDGGSDDDSTATSPDTNSHSNGSRPKFDVQPNPFEKRPKRTPVPPSSRTASPFKQSGYNSPTSSSAFSGSNKADVGVNDTSSARNNASSNTSQEKGSKSMYGTTPFFPTTSSVAAPLQHATIPSTRKLPRLPKNNIWQGLGAWAKPSTICPIPTKCATSAPQRDHPKWQDSAQADIRGTTQLDPTNGSAPSQFPQALVSLSSRFRSLNVLEQLQAAQKSEENAPRPMGLDDSSMKNLNRCFTHLPNNEAFTPTNAKSKSEENINTNFSPSQWAGAFNANNIFAAPPPANASKPHSPLHKSSRILRSQASGNVGQEATSTGNFFAPPTPTPATGETHIPSPLQRPFDANDWAEQLKDSSWPFGTSHPDPTRTMSRGRNASGKTTSVKIPTTVPKAATATAVEDETTVEDVNGTTSAENQSVPVHEPDDAMDIDMGGVSPAPTPRPVDTPGPNSAAPTKEPRFIPVDSSTLRPAQAAPSATMASKNEAPLKANLADLASVLTDTPTNGTGINSLDDISINLPFTSKPSSTPPISSKIYTPQLLTLPKLPQPPDSPTKLTKKSWHAYCEGFARYLSRWHDFDGEMGGHFRARRQGLAALVAKGSGALEAVGDEAFLKYSMGVKEDERVREFWNLACERHTTNVQAFEAVRDRVKKVSEAGGLMEG